MVATKFSALDRRRALIVTAAAVMLVVGGAGLIGASLASQRRSPPQPPVGGFGATPAAIVGEPQSWLRTAASAIARLENASPEAIGPVLGRSKPVTLEIPSIGVDSSVQHLGLTAEDALEVPSPGPHYNDAAWYRHSPAPGSLGPAIVLGHVDSATEGPSVFFRLGELRPGERVSITRADDSIAVFTVDEVHRYNKDDFPTELVYSDIDHAGLRIVTCGGAFDDSTGHYLDNIVVFASLVGSG